jgi:hypothetical protein
MPPATLVSVGEAGAALADSGLSATQLAQLWVAVGAASDAIERWCNRRFVAADHAEVLRPDAAGIALLRHLPVIGVRRLAYGRSRAFSITNVELGGALAYRASAAFTYPDGADPIGRPPAGIRLRRTSMDGVETSSTIDLAEHPTVNRAILAVASVPGGWTASVRPGAAWGFYPSAELVGLEAEREVLVDWTRPAPPRHPIPVFGFAWPLTSGWFDLDRAAGILQVQLGRPLGGMGDLADARAFADPPTTPDGVPPGGEVLALYRAGFEAVPRDVKAICVEAAKRILQGHAADETVSEERGINYSYKLRSTAELVVGSLPDDALRALSTYRVHHT